MATIIPRSGYGSFGSLVMLMLWVYYSAQILLFGAEYTRAYATRHGSRSDAASKERVRAAVDARRRQAVPT